MVSLFSLILALLLTIVLEFFVLLFILRKDPFKLFVYSTLVNAFTNPLLNYLYNYVFPHLYFWEVTVVLVETVILAALVEIGYKKAFQVSLAANALTLFVGLLLAL